jgi:serine/threonine-protein kinase
VTTEGVSSVFAQFPLATLPHGLAFDAAGNLFVGVGNHQIEKITAEGAVSLFAQLDNQFDPGSLAFDRQGNLFVTDFDRFGIYEFTPAGTGRLFASTTNLGPFGLAFDKAGKLYVSQYFDNEILKYAPDGSGSVFATNLIFRPEGIAFDSKGDLDVSDLSGPIIRVTPNGVSSLYTNGLAYASSIAFQPGALPEPSSAGVIALGPVVLMRRARGRRG